MWWRGAIIASILGLWLAAGIAWGAQAALVFGFFVFISLVYMVWALLNGRFMRRAGGWYADRQLNHSGSGRWRDHR